MALGSDRKVQEPGRKGTVPAIAPRRFANSGPNASGVVIKFETRRLPMWSGQMQDSELLFFWQLGFDGERLSIYN
jgi:hypothetical protein